MPKSFWHYDYETLRATYTKYNEIRYNTEEWRYLRLKTQCIRTMADTFLAVNNNSLQPQFSILFRIGGACRVLKCGRTTGGERSEFEGDET